MSLVGAAPMEGVWQPLATSPMHFIFPSPNFIFDLVILLLGVWSTAKPSHLQAVPLVCFVMEKTGTIQVAISRALWHIHKELLQLKERMKEKEGTKVGRKERKKEEGRKEGRKRREGEEKGGREEGSKKRKETLWNDTENSRTMPPFG